MAASKQTLRKQFALIRDEAHAKATPAIWGKMSANLWSFEPFASSSTVLLYCSKDSEAPTQDLIQKALDNGKRVALPITHAKERTMELSFISSIDDLVPSSFGILEPKLSTLATCKPSEVKCALVPGIAFDNEGFRLGWGLGFYDRFLPSLSCPTVGFCYEAQIAPSIPHEKFDVPVSALVTEVAARAIIRKEK